MTEPLQVGQFAIVDYEPVDRGPNAGVFHGKGPADDRAELYIVAEGTTPAGESFAGHVISAAGQAWNTLDMSLTGALRRLFADAERSLRDWNRKSIAQHRVSIGMTCFGRRGSHAVIAQAGPGAVFHWHDGEVRPYFADEEHGRPLGLGASVEPQLTRIDFAPGDRLLVLSTPALRELDDELIGGILGLEPEKILGEIYHRLQHLRNLTVLLIQKPPARGRSERQDTAAAAADEYVIDATGPQSAPPPSSGASDPPQQTPAHQRPLLQQIFEANSRSYQPSLFIDDRSQDAILMARQRLVEVSSRARYASMAHVAPEDIPEPLQRVAGENRLALLAADHRARAAVGAASIANGRPARPPVPQPLETANDNRRRVPRGSFTRGLVHDEPPPKPIPALEDAPLVDDLAEDLRSRASTAVHSRMTEAIADDNAASLSNGGSLVRVRDGMSGRWKGGGTLSRKRPVVGGTMPPTWLVILVGLGILLTLVGFVTVPGMLSDQAEERYATLLDEAERHIATANANPDPAGRRAELTEAQGILLEARDAENAGPEANQLLDEVASALNVMDAIREPVAVEQIASLEQFGDRPVAAARLVVGEGHAYILDAAASQVIDVALDGGDRKVVFAEDKDAKHGQPLAEAYLATQDLGGPGLLVVDSAKVLWAINAAGEVRQLDFAAPKGMNVTDIAIFGRDLYVLDASASKILQFTPTDNGYGAAPREVLETPDLAAARRLMVDKEIVTSDADGTVHRFVNQLSIVLSEAGIDSRLVEARQPNRIGNEGNIAVVDAPNNRIVVLRPDGAFDHQYRHKEFASITALAMKDGIGYAFAGGKLLRVVFEAGQ